MTDRPTNRIPRPAGPPAERGGRNDARTPRVHQQQSRSSAMPTSRFFDDESNVPTQANPMAWSQDHREGVRPPGYYPEPSSYDPGGYQPYVPQHDEDAGLVEEPNPVAGQRRSWLRLSPTLLVAAAAVAVLAAGGGLAYTLTGSNHQNPAPAQRSVAPAPQQNGGGLPPPQLPPSMPVDSPAPAPDAPVSAPDDNSGPAPNVDSGPAPNVDSGPAPAAPPPSDASPAPASQQPNTQQQPDPNQQQPNNQQQQNNPLPNNQQPNNQQQPNNNQQQPNNNQQQPNNNQQQQQNNQQQPNKQHHPQKQESPNDTLCHPKPPPC